MYFVIANDQKRMELRQGSELPKGALVVSKEDFSLLMEGKPAVDGAKEYAAWVAKEKVQAAQEDETPAPVVDPLADLAAFLRARPDVMALILKDQK